MKSISLLITVFLFSGCFSSYPLNLTKEEYEPLTLEKKIQLKKQQAILDNKIKIKRIEYEKQQAKFLYEKQQKEQEKLEKLYKTNRDKILVFISNGKFSKINEYFIVPFEVKKFEVKKIKVFNKKTNRLSFYLWVSFQETGLYIGIEPKKFYKKLDSYVSVNNNDFFKNLSFKPAIIPYSHKWFKNKKYIISYKSRYYKAQNLKVEILLKRY